MTESVFVALAYSAALGAYFLYLVGLERRIRRTRLLGRQPHERSSAQRPDDGRPSS